MCLFLLFYLMMLFDKIVGAILHYALVRSVMGDEGVMKHGPYICFIL